MENPHFAEWWFTECFKVWQEFFLGGEMGYFQWRWDRFEWQSRASTHAHSCSPWNAEPSERLAEFSRTFLKGFIKHRRRGESEGQERDEGAYSNDVNVYARNISGCRSRSCLFWATWG